LVGYDLDMLISTDLLQFIKSFNLVSCMNGKAFDINGRISPIGNIEYFIYKNEVKVFNEQRKIQNCGW
jgi:hypothetical protein